jgi:hypothetical protein
LWYGRASSTTPIFWSRSSCSRIARPSLRWSTKKRSWAMKPSSTARLFSSSLSPSASWKYSNICRLHSLRSAICTKGITSLMPFWAKMSPSFTNAARVVSAEPTTVGHAREPTVPDSQVSIESTCGNTIMCSGRRLCFTSMRLCMWAMHTFDGKHGSIAPRLAPSLYSSSEV